FFPVTPTPEIYTLSLHDALPISVHGPGCAADRAGRNHHQCSHDEHRDPPAFRVAALFHDEEDEPRGDTEPTERVEPKCVTAPPEDRKSTRLNSSHDQISYAVFCL